jgi:hypothetical protein
MTNWTNITTFEQMILEANRYAPFWSAMLMMIWVILILTFLPFGMTAALVAGSFIGGLIGLFLVYMGVVSWKWVLGLFAFSVVIIIIETFFTRKEN